jgi:hypothetical protein
MPKTVALTDDTHTLITEKKLELFRKYRITVKIADIVDAAIKYGINNVDSVFVPSHMTARLNIVEEEDMK